MAKTKIMNEHLDAIEYKMPDLMAREILKERTGNEFKMNPHDYLCQVVNEIFGLKGHCVKVIRF